MPGGVSKAADISAAVPSGKNDVAGAPTPAAIDAFIDTFIDTFIDALWVEDGLSTLTLSAYRRDLGLLAA